MYNPEAPGVSSGTRPEDEYARRRQSRAATHERWERVSFRFSRARLVVFGVGAAVGLMVIRGAVPLVWLVLPVVVFLGLVVWHDRIMRASAAAARGVEYYDHGLARVQDRWQGAGPTGSRFLDPVHLYAADLDLFGTSSLFQLLSRCRTAIGEDTLARWLLQPSPTKALRGRQLAVGELGERLDFREQLCCAGPSVAAIDTTMLRAWAASPPGLTWKWPRVVAPGLVASLVGAAAWTGLGGSARWLLALAVVQAAFATAFRTRVLRIVHGVERPATELEVLARVLRLLERLDVSAPHLVALRGRLTERPGLMASEAIGRLHRLSAMHDWQHNQLFAPIGACLLWSTQLAWAIEAWRQAFGRHVPQWLETLGEYEALASLATYAYEHPRDPFPSWLEGEVAAGDGRHDRQLPPPGGEGTVFDGIGLGHPLLPATEMVTNDVRLSRGMQLLLVSGSNMSGKSTLLRTVGINIVLAHAGAPVRADRLSLRPVDLGATLRIQDSLQEGRSRFYAEVARVRDIARLTRSGRPVVFLLDEIFQGTNSHDRVVGAEAVLRRLLEEGAVGLVTTHDLALTAIVDRLGRRASNVHFDDRFEEGRLVFDYRMKPGPVTRSNALALMRAVGLLTEHDVDRDHTGDEGETV